MVHADVLDEIKQIHQVDGFAVNRINSFSGHALALVFWYTSSSFCDATKQNLESVENAIQGLIFIKSPCISGNRSYFICLGILLKK